MKARRGVTFRRPSTPTPQGRALAEAQRRLDDAERDLVAALRARDEALLTVHRLKAVA